MLGGVTYQPLMTVELQLHELLKILSLSQTVLSSPSIASSDLEGKIHCSITTKFVSEVKLFFN